MNNSKESDRWKSKEKVVFRPRKKFQVQWYRTSIIVKWLKVVIDERMNREKAKMVIGGKLLVQVTISLLTTIKLSYLFTFGVNIY